MKFKSYIAALHAALLCILLAASPAGSGSIALIGVGPPPVASGGGFSLAYQSSAGSTDTSSTSVNYGTLAYAAGATRTIVGVQWFPGGTVSGVTVGGVALAQISGAFNNQSAGINIDAWQSSASLSGSSGAVIVTYTSAVAFVSSVALYSLNTTTPAASATAQGFNSFTTAASTSSITVPAGGGGMVLCMTGNTSAFSFTGSSTLDAAVFVGGETDTHYGHTTATGSLTPGCTWTGSSPVVITAIAWGP